MTYNTDIHHRRSIRLKGFDYSSANAYFVTMCVRDRECLFGAIVDGAMTLNDAGRMVETAWAELSERFPRLVIDEFMVMPNHVHGIIVIMGSVGAPLAAPGCESDQKGEGAASSAPTLGQIMRAFKSLSAIGVNRLLQRQQRPLWQRNYYERIIRNENELAAVRDYIRQNIVNWAGDEENPENTDL